MSESDLKRFRHNYQKEIDGAFLYKALSNRESTNELATVYSRLATSEEKHAEIWKKRIVDLGENPPPNKPTWRAKVLAMLAKRFGNQFVLPTISGNEVADSRAYDDQPENETKFMARDEKSHALIVAEVLGFHRSCIYD